MPRNILLEANGLKTGFGEHLQWIRTVFNKSDYTGQNSDFSLHETASSKGWMSPSDVHQKAPAKKTE